MRPSVSAIVVRPVAIAAALAVIGSAHAQTYTGHSAVAGSTTVIPAANDLPSVPDLQTLWIRVTTTTAGPSAWIAAIQFANRVALPGVAAQNDLYKTMNVNFSVPMFNGTFEFVVDTDRLY